MKVAPRKRGSMPDVEIAPSVQAGAARFHSISEGAVDAARRDYMEALPVAAAILCQDDEGRVFIDIANEIFWTMIGWSPAETSVWADEIDFFPATGIDAAVDAFLGQGERAHQFEGRDLRTVSQRFYTVRLAKLKPAPYAPQRCLLSLIDKTAQVETEKSLRSEMLRDTLSGLPNRLAFNEQIEAASAGHSWRDPSHAVLVVDMARFSRVNECAGAIAGDELLITFARRLFSALRPGDVLARTGGDEFGILIRLDKSIEDALRFAERIKGVLSTPFRLSEMEISVDCAIGCALLSKNDMAEETLRNAQFALKRSKATGRVQLYEPDQAQAALRRFSIETELRRALEAGQLELAFQPLIELSTGQTAGFEALARWQHPVQGAIAPTEFIAVAEESGLILPLGRWALDAALATLADWDRQAGRELPLYMSVNLSAVQIQRDDVPHMVSETLAKHGIDGRRLMFELTESAIIQDPQRAGDVLSALQAMGVRIALDDFGSGYTSLAYLQRLPIDLLKIDGSFVTRMLEDPDATAIVRAVLSIAGALGMATTAEGIECPELVRALATMGCTNGQGFHFSAPLPGGAALDYGLSRSA